MSKVSLLSSAIVLMVANALYAQSSLPNRIYRNALCSTGPKFPETFVIETDTNSRTEAQSSLTRALLSASSQQKVKLNFSFLGPIADPVNNPNGHLQIGIKLKAANTCNVLYAVWDIGNKRLEVSIKRNDGIVGTCGPNGYTLLDPVPPLPEVLAGSNHTLQAELINDTLNVWADDVLVWSGVVGYLPFDGPVGLRTDGGLFKVDFLTQLNSPLSAANLNVPVYATEPCNPAKPSIQFPASGYVLTKNQAMTPIVPFSYGGVITGCSISPAIANVSINSSTCAISGTPSNSQSSTIHTVTASNGRGTFSKNISIRVMAPPTITYSSNSYKLTTTATTSIIPTYTGNAVESCTISKPLPNGLSLSSQCAITGRATALSLNSSYTITAKNAVGTNSKTINLEVISPPVLIYSASSYSFALNSSVSITLRNNNGAGSPPTSCTIDKALPSGIAFNTTSCTISGTAKAKTTSPITYKVTGTNSAGTGSVFVTISVN